MRVGLKKAMELVSSKASVYEGVSNLAPWFSHNIITVGRTLVDLKQKIRIAFL